MLDDIYPRLLLEIIPDELKLNSLGIQRLVAEHNSGTKFNAVYGQLIKSIYQAQPDSNIGIQFGKYLLPSNLCDFSRVLITSQNLKSALELIQRSYSLHSGSYYPFISHRKGVVSISLTFPYKSYVPSRQRRFCAESVFSYLINAIRVAISTDFQPKKVTFDYKRPNYATEYTPLFGENVCFGRQMCLIEFDEQILYRPLSTSNPVLHQMYLNKCLDDMRLSERQNDFEYKAITYLLLHHPESFNSKKLATKLNISVRGLQKKLNKQELSFSYIANLTRRELAKVYLIQEKQSIDYTAEQLGFQTDSGFRRFFKTEFDVNPVEYLKQANLSSGNAYSPFQA